MKFTPSGIFLEKWLSASKHSNQRSLKSPTSESHVDSCIGWVQSLWPRQATASDSRLEPTSSGARLWCNRSRWWKECQLSHWDPVCHRPHLSDRTLPRAVHLELSLDLQLRLCCATPSLSPHRIKPSAAPSASLHKPRPRSLLRHPTENYTV